MLAAIRQLPTRTHFAILSCHRHYCKRCYLQPVSTASPAHLQVRILSRLQYHGAKRVCDTTIMRFSSISSKSWELSSTSEYNSVSRQQILRFTCLIADMYYIHWRNGTPAVGNVWGKVLATSKLSGNHFIACLGKYLDVHFSRDARFIALLY